MKLVSGWIFNSKLMTKLEAGFINSSSNTLNHLSAHCPSHPLSFFLVFRNMWKAVSVTLVVMVTTPWNSETPWAVCRVHVTSMALCQRVYVICGPDSAHAERGWRAHSVPTVPTTTITEVCTSRVRSQSDFVSENFENNSYAPFILLTKVLRRFRSCHSCYE